MLTETLASTFARAALADVEREDPRAVGHLHWLLMRVLRLYPMIAENGRLAAALDARLAPAAIEAELAHFEGDSLFGRPHGWAWLLELQAEALRMKARWSRALQPLATHVASNMADFVALPEPTRSGAEGNSAFACILTLDYARAAGDQPLEFAIARAAKRWYGSDRDAPLACEPSQGDFLSPTLVEAVLMKQVLQPVEFMRWLNGFLPEGIGPLATPSSSVALCLSRAWCLGALGLSDPAERHLAAVGGNYAGEPWLASFAVLALTGAALKTP